MRRAAFSFSGSKRVGQGLVLGTLTGLRASSQ